PAPDGNGTVQFIDSTFPNDRYNSSGDYAYKVRLDGYTGDMNYRYAIFLKDGNVTKQIARAGMPGPGGTTISVVSNNTSPSMNEAGQFTFVATLVGGPALTLIRSDGVTMTRLFD